LEKFGGDLSQMDNSDEFFFYETLNQTPKLNIGFENNWAYIMQSTRNGFWKYKNHNSVIYITTHDVDNDGPIVIPNMLGLDYISVLKEIIEACDAFYVKIIIKNIDERTFYNLKTLGFSETNEMWSEYSFRDDNSFPQMIYNLDDEINMSHWSNGHKGIIHKHGKNPTFFTALYNDENYIKAIDLLAEYSNYSFEKGKDFKEEIFKGHLFFFDESISQKIRLQHKRGEDLIGIHYFIKHNNLLYWNALVNINESNIMRVMFWDSLVFLKKHYPELEFIVCQGSESYGQYLFKKNLKPDSNIVKIHMIR